MKRAEWMLKVLAIRGRIYRSEFREKIDILINCQIDTRELLKEIGEQQKRTDEQLKRTDEQIEAFAANTERALDRLAASQVKTDEVLRRFINSLNKNRNGHSEN